MSFWLQPGLSEEFAQLESFDGVLNADGQLFRDLPQRQTLRIESRGRSLFIKRHLGVGWREIFKNYLQLRLPVISAENEFLAIKKLQALGVETMTCVGYGKRGSNPARQQSFIITDDLVGSVSLEDYCADWGREGFDKPRLLIKRSTHCKNCRNRQPASRPWREPSRFLYLSFPCLAGSVERRHDSRPGRCPD